ncbi:acetoin dehydrogenase, partial [Mycobacterium tuberculosis]
KVLDLVVRLTGSGYQRIFPIITGRLIPRPR